MSSSVIAEVVRLMIRLPVGLHADLVRRAKADNRSLNNLIVTWLRRALDAGW